MAPPFQPSDRFPPHPWPREGVPEYNLKARSHGGPLLGADVREFDWTLEVDSRSGMITAETFRSDGDVPGHAVGVYRQRVPDDDLVAIHKALIESKLDALDPKQETHPGYTQTTYTVWTPQDMLQKTVNNSDHPANTKIRPLVNQVNGWLGKTLRFPESAMKIVLTLAKDPAGARFEAAFTNVGVLPICMTDPRWIASTQYRYAAVRVSPYKEPAKGDMPFFSWTDLPLLPMDPRPKDEPTVTIAPGQSYTARTGTWKPAIAGMKHMAYASWSDYTGPAAVEGAYRVRGRTQSERIEIGA